MSVDVVVDLQQAARDSLALGEAEQAVDFLEQLVDVGPMRLSVVHDLVRALQAAGRADESIVMMQRLVLAAVHRADLHLQLIRMLESADRRDDAVVAAQIGCQRHPDDATMWSSLEVLARTTEKWQIARDAGRRLVHLHPGDADSWRRLALAARHTGDDELVGEALTGWLAAGPDNPTARHLHAAHHGLRMDRADPGYITALFDSYADGFDEHLSELGYRAPELLVARVGALLAGPVGVAADLGCGTGQVGVLLRPSAHRLVGVDLSPGMLAKASQRGVYDELTDDELTAFLRARSNAFDLVVSADTLIYIGDLRPVFRAAAGALRNGGRFVFTLETGQNEEAEQGYALARSGRYVHDPRWVVAQLAAAGFSDIHHDPCVLRFEDGQEVHGVLVDAFIHRAN